MFRNNHDSNHRGGASNPKHSSPHPGHRAAVETLENRRYFAAVTSDITAPVAWSAYTHVTAAQLTSDVKAQNARIIDLKVEPGSTLKFTAVLVHNTGPYASAWWWYYGQTAAQVSSDVKTLHARIVSYDPYVVSGHLYFATLLVPYTAGGPQSFTWAYGQTASSIAAQLKAHDGRLIDLEPYSLGGKTYYADVIVPNTGANAETWYWYVGVTPSEIPSLLKKDDSRIVDMNAESNGTFDLILEKNDGVAWWYYYGETFAQISALAKQNDARIFDLDTYGNSVHSAVMVSNTP